MTARPRIATEGSAHPEIERVFAEVAPTLWRTLVAYTAGRVEIADEAVAEAFARAIERWDGIRRPVPWLYRTAFRIALEEMRRERREPSPAGYSGTELPHEFQNLVGALRRLSPNQRAAVLLHYEADLPIREVSRLTGVSVPTLKVHLHRARARLRMLLGTEEDSPQTGGRA